MNTVKILHTADIHLGARENHLDTLAQNRRYETLLTFENTVSYAIDNGVKLFLIAGDLFDSNKIESEFFDRFFDAVDKAHEIKFVFAAGNHDPISSESPFLKHPIPDNFFMLKPEDCVVEFADLGVRVYGSSFNSVYKRGKERFLLTPPDDDIINIMCIHGELRSDLNSDYNSITEGFIASSGMDYIALGHIHRRTSVEKVGNTYVSYCGCPEGHGFDETGEKGVYIGEIFKGGHSLEFLPTAKRKYICEQIDITNSENIAETVVKKLKSLYGDTFAENLYKIILTGEIEENAKPDTAELKARLSNELYFIKLRDETQYKLNFEALAGEKSLKGIFVRKMLERINGCDSSNAQLQKQALKIGLTAFNSEVSFDEN